MTYELGFLDSALKEWRKLDPQTRDQFKKKLAERLDAPHVPASKLWGAKDRYKIKLRNVGYRLFYEVHDTEVIVVVLAVGRRDRNAVYKAAEKRTDTAAAVTTMKEARQAPDDTGASEYQRLTGRDRTLLNAASDQGGADLDFEPPKLGDISRPADLDWYSAADPGD